MGSENRTQSVAVTRLHGPSVESCSVIGQFLEDVLVQVCTVVCVRAAVFFMVICMDEKLESATNWTGG